MHEIYVRGIFSAHMTLNSFPYFNIQQWLRLFLLFCSQQCNIIARNKWFYRIFFFSKIEAKRVKLCQVSVMGWSWHVYEIFRELNMANNSAHRTRTRANSYGICTKSKTIPTKSRCCNGNGWPAIIIHSTETRISIAFVPIHWNNRNILQVCSCDRLLCTSLKIFLYRTLNIETRYLEQRMLRFHWVAYCCSVLI